MSILRTSLPLWEVWEAQHAGAFPMVVWELKDDTLPETNQKGTCFCFLSIDFQGSCRFEELLFYIQVEVVAVFFGWQAEIRCHITVGHVFWWRVLPILGNSSEKDWLTRETKPPTVVSNNLKDWLIIPFRLPVEKKFSLKLLEDARSFLSLHVTSNCKTNKKYKRIFKIMTWILGLQAPQAEKPHFPARKETNKNQWWQ